MTLYIRMMFPGYAISDRSSLPPITYAIPALSMLVRNDSGAASPPPKWQARPYASDPFGLSLSLSLNLGATRFSVADPITHSAATPKRCHLNKPHTRTPRCYGVCHDHRRVLTFSKPANLSRRESEKGGKENISGTGRQKEGNAKMR